MSHKQFKHVGTPPIKAIEECSELIHIICKAERFGLDNYHPDDPSKTSNQILIYREISDVREAIDNLEKWLEERE